MPGRFSRALRPKTPVFPAPPRLCNPPLPSRALGGPPKPSCFCAYPPRADLKPTHFRLPPFCVQRLAAPCRPLLFAVSLKKEKVFVKNIDFFSFVVKNCTTVLHLASAVQIAIPKGRRAAPPQTAACGIAVLPLPCVWALLEKRKNAALAFHPIFKQGPAVNLTKIKKERML